MPTPDRNPLSQARVTQIYDRNAPFYDAMETPMEWMALRAWRRDLISGLSGHVLELGVGTGHNLALYPADVVLTAVDVAPSMLKRARARARQLGIDATFVQADMRDLPFETASFDAVVTSCVFCSVTEPRVGLTEARRVLKPGGHLRMLEHQRPEPPLLGWLFDRLNPLVVRLTGANVNRETQRTVESAGFSFVHARRLDRLGIVRLFDACEPELDTVSAASAPAAHAPRDSKRRTSSSMTAPFCAEQIVRTMPR